MRIIVPKDKNKEKKVRTESCSCMQLHIFTSLRCIGLAPHVEATSLGCHDRDHELFRTRNVRNNFL